MNILKDERVNCYSVMTKITIADYLQLVQKAYAKRGGIEGQREAVKTSTAKRIRERMIQDLKDGAVLPPVVVGVVVSDDVFGNLACFISCPAGTSHEFQAMIHEIPPEKISIIDGMQRTSALYKSEHLIDLNKEMRVEYWLAANTNSLIYRLLVLNTGQLPWNLRRQIELVFSAVIAEIKNKVPSMQVLELNGQRERPQAGQFQADRLIELFLVFGARKGKIDTRQRLAEAFARQDFIESTANQKFTERFYDVLEYLAKFDKAFDRYQSKNKPEPYTIRFKDGTDLFKNKAACVGFVTAMALQIFGRPGMHYSPEEQNKKWYKIKAGADILLAKLYAMDAAQVGNFLAFDILNEWFDGKYGPLGEFEREFFLHAFKVLIEENFNPQTMEPCWRAY